MIDRFILAPITRLEVPSVSTYTVEFSLNWRKTPKVKDRIHI